MRYWWIAIGLIAMAAIIAAAWFSPARQHKGRPARSDGTVSRISLPQDAYIWQRSWTPEVLTAVHAQHSQFRRLVVLAAEISMKDSSVVTVKPDWGQIAQAVDEIGLAIRVGALPAAQAATAFNDDSPQIQMICQAGLSAITKAHAAGLKIVELQIDFDCAESKLEGYQKWVRALKIAVMPVPVVITVLPSWLRHHEFIVLAHETDGFILQVHSLHRPTSPNDPMQLCDADESRRAVIDALASGVKFRLALPTYSYLAGFSSSGTFLGLAGEGVHPSWPDDAIVKTMRSDPSVIAGLVSELSQNHPDLLTGIIWYRLPVAGDKLNWQMATLQAVMAGRTPHPKLETLVVRAASGATDIYLANSGDADASAQCAVIAEWGNANLVAADGINGFDHLDSVANRVTFSSAASEQWIVPGDRLQIGWLRLSVDTEVKTHVQSSR